MNECILCGDNVDTRFGVCFRCAECEYIIETGKDMYDNIVAVTSMDKLKQVMQRFHILTQPLKECEKCKRD